LEIIPVIDILNGKVVHAVRGKRQEYQSLQSSLCKSVEPIKVAEAFRKLGFCELYIADLDAIAGGSMNFQVFERIAKETGLKLMVDAGVADLEKAQKLLRSGVFKVIIGTETLIRESFVGEAVRFFGGDHVMVSLDFKGEEVLLKSRFDSYKTPLRLLREFKGMGISEVIVLDLARVGSGEGVNVDFLKKVLEDVSLHVYVGGGVRDIKDLVELKKLGVAGVLLATSLHSGRISAEQLKRAKLLS